MLVSKVLITGGAGFIGSHVADRFIQNGFDVVIVDDLSTGQRGNVHPRSRFFELDICSPEARQLVRSETPELIIHAAAQMSVRKSMEDPSYDARVNVQGFSNILSAIADPSGTHVIFFSTGGAIYGEQDAFPATEEHVKRPTSLYGLNKWVGEQYLSFWERSFGLKSTALRLGNVYGGRQNPHGEAGVVAIFFEHLFANQKVKIFGDGKQTRDFIFVADVVDAVECAARTQMCGAFNIGTGIETSVEVLYRQMCDIVGASEQRELCPARLGEQMRSVISPVKAATVLGWTPNTSLRDGLSQTAEFFRLQRP